MRSKIIQITEYPHTVLHGRFLINQCFGPLNKPGFNFYTYYGFLSFNSIKPGGEINRENNLKIPKKFLKLIKFIWNIQKIFSWKESVAMFDVIYIYVLTNLTAYGCGFTVN